MHRTHRTYALRKVDKRLLRLLKVKSMFIAPGLDIHIYRNRVLAIRDLRKRRRFLTVAMINPETGETKQLSVDITDMPEVADLMEHTNELRKYLEQTNEELAS